MNFFSKIAQNIKNKRKLTFLFADDFLAMLLVYRALWVQGRYGGGKTSLAVILSAWLLSKGHVKTVRTNFPSVLSTQVDDFELLYDAALIVDETNVFISDRKAATGYANFLRKTNYFLLMPSVMPPHIKLTSFSVQRIFNGYIYGLPIWVYNWSIRFGNIKEKGYFAILYPDAVFGAYDTGAIPFSDGGIADGIERTMRFEQWVSWTTKGISPTPEQKEDLKAQYVACLYNGVDLADNIPVRKSKSKRKQEDEHDDYSEITGALEDTAEEVQRASADIENTAGKIKRKIRRL